MTVSAISVPLFSYPAAPGGLLYTYASGGTTPQTTYEADGVTPNTNPVVLDTNGNAVVRGNGAFHLLLKDSTGVTTLWDYDGLLYGSVYQVYAVDSGAVNAIAVTNTSVTVTTGSLLQVKLANTNTSTSVTLNVNATGTKTVLMNTGQAPAIGQLIANQIYLMQYDGTNWLVINSSLQVDANGAATIPAPASGSALTVNGSAETPTYNIGNSGTAFTLNCDKSNVQRLAMTGNVASGGWTISNPRDGQTINLRITQGVGPYTLGWPASFIWVGGSAGTITAVNGAVDLLVITYQSDISKWLASLQKGFA